MSPEQYNAVDKSLRWLAACVTNKLELKKGVFATLHDVDSPEYARARANVEHWSKVKEFKPRDCGVRHKGEDKLDCMTPQQHVTALHMHFLSFSCALIFMLTFVLYVADCQGAWRI